MSNPAIDRQWPFLGVQYQNSSNCRRNGWHDAPVSSSPCSPPPQKKDQYMKASAMKYLVVLVSILPLEATCASADQAADETAIRKNAEAYVAAYNKHDAKAL